MERAQGKSYFFDKVATSGYICTMEISAKEAKNKFSELLSRAEAGETVVLTRHGKVVANLVPPPIKQGGIDFAALDAIKKEYGVTNLVSYISPDFDDPLPEDYLITATTDPQ
jgi:prevent-host-death family protein